jgi:hypothetical protein
MIRFPPLYVGKMGDDRVGWQQELSAHYYFFIRCDT